MKTIRLPCSTPCRIMHAVVDESRHEMHYLTQNTIARTMHERIITTLALRLPRSDARTPYIAP